MYQDYPGNFDSSSRGSSGSPGHSECYSSGSSGSIAPLVHQSWGRRTPRVPGVPACDIPPIDIFLEMIDSRARGAETLLCCPLASGQKSDAAPRMQSMDSVQSVMKVWEPEHNGAKAKTLPQLLLLMSVTPLHQHWLDHLGCAVGRFPD